MYSKALHVRTCMCVCMCVRACVCVHACVCMCVYVCVCILFQVCFHYGLPQDIEYSSLHYTVSPCGLSVLYMVVCIC